MPRWKRNGRAQPRHPRPAVKGGIASEKQSLYDEGRKAGKKGVLSFASCIPAFLIKRLAAALSQGSLLRRASARSSIDLHRQRAVALTCIYKHLTVAEAPGRFVLGAKPDQTAGAALDLVEHEGVGRVVVAAAVADHDHGGAAVDGADSEPRWRQPRARRRSLNWRRRFTTLPAIARSTACATSACLKRWVTSPRSLTKT